MVKKEGGKPPYSFTQKSRHLLFISLGNKPKLSSVEYYLGVNSTGANLTYKITYNYNDYDIVSLKDNIKIFISWFKDVFQTVTANSCEVCRSTDLDHQLYYKVSSQKMLFPPQSVEVQQSFLG